MKKSTMKFAGLFLALVMVIAMTAVMSSAVVPNNSGKIVVNVPEASKGEETYNIYEILKIESYTVDDSATTSTEEETATYILKNADWADFLTAQGFVLDENETKGVTYVTQGTAQIDADFAKAALAYAEEEGIDPTATQTSSSGVATFTGLEEGWYLVDSTVGTLCMIDNTMAEVEIDDKNDNEPTITKVVADTAAGTGAAELNSKIGDTVYFTITLDDVAGLKDVSITDICDTGLTIDTNSFAITDDGTTVASTDVTVTATNDPYGFTINFKEGYIPAGDIVVTYSALVNATAVTENDNDATISWGNNNTSTASEATVKTIALDFAKVDGDNKIIEGAAFKIYAGAAEASATELSLIYDSTLSAYRPVVGSESAATNIPVGKAKIVGLDADLLYFADEVVTPDGYNSIEGKAALNKSENTGYDSLDTGDVYAIANGGTAIVNQKGSILPSTGGEGTTVYYMIGTLIVLVAAVLFVSKKRLVAAK